MAIFPLQRLWNYLGKHWENWKSSIKFLDPCGRFWIMNFLILNSIYSLKNKFSLNAFFSDSTSIFTGCAWRALSKANAILILSYANCVWSVCSVQNFVLCFWCMYSVKPYNTWCPFFLWIFRQFLSSLDTVRLKNWAELSPGWSFMKAEKCERPGQLWPRAFVLEPVKFV